MDLSKIKALIIVVLAAFIAVYLGMAAATSKVEVLIWMGSIIAVTGCLLLGKNIWALIPCGLAIAGGLNFLPGAPPVWWLASMAAGGMLLLRFATRKDNFQWRLTLLDWIVFLQFIAVAQAYLRNPTGLSFFGGDMAGGRPYIAFCISFGTYFLLSIMKTDLKTFRIVVICVIAIMLGDGLIKLIAQFVPPFAAILLPIYSGIDFDAGYMNREVDLMESRVNSGVEIGGTLGLVLVCFYPPLTTINPLFFLRFCGMIIASFLILISGFRSVFGMLVIQFFVSLWIRRQYAQTIVAVFIAILGAVVLLLIGSLVQSLPAGAERVLSVLPFVQVDENKRDDAQKSSDWRFEMWREALSSNRYIRNKALGDGFGLSAVEQKAQMDSVFGDKRRTRGMTIQDMMLERGSYHGFHVETIRFTGTLGLIIALIGLFTFLRYAYILIRHFQGSPYWGHVLFICLPFLIYPFSYLLIFGSYKSGFAQLIASAGMLKLLDNIRFRELAASRADARASKKLATANINDPKISFLSNPVRTQ